MNNQRATGEPCVSYSVCCAGDIRQCAISAETAQLLDRDSAIAAWNTRHVPEPSEAEIERVAIRLERMRHESAFWSDKDAHDYYRGMARAAIAAMHKHAPGG